VPEGFGNVGSGGSFGPEMKYAGYDHMVIKGKARKPTYIYIENDDVFFKDASALWGKGVFETNKLIREELGDPEVAILAIGQAGRGWFALLPSSMNTEAALRWEQFGELRTLRP